MYVFKVIAKLAVECLSLKQILNLCQNSVSCWLELTFVRSVMLSHSNKTLFTTGIQASFSQMNNFLQSIKISSI